MDDLARLSFKNETLFSYLSNDFIAHEQITQKQKEQEFL